MISQSHLQALKIILSRLEGQPIPWAVTGSVGLRLQGVDVEVHDIDLQTDRAGAYEIERLMAEWVVTPVRFLESSRIRSHLGELAVNGVKVEVMGDIQKRGEDGEWEEIIPVERHLLWIELDGLRVPVFALEYEYQAYLRMGRIEKTEKIRKKLQKSE